MLAVVFVVLSSWLLQVFGQSPNPPNPGNYSLSKDCPYPPNCNSNIKVNGSSGADVNFSPFYEFLLSPGGDHEASDGVCCTFFSAGDENNKTFYLIRSIKYNNGSTNIHRLVYSTIGSIPGAFTAQGLAGPDGCDSCVLYDFALAQPCPGVFLFNRCYVSGDCERAYNVAGRDNILAFSSSPTISPECYDETLRLAGELLRDPEPIRLPYSLTPRCVTQVGGATAINADRVPCEYRVTLP